VIAKALATAPDDRYVDARAFSAALSAAIGHSGETLTARAARRHLSRGTWMWVAGLALAILGVSSMMPPVRDRIARLTVRVDTAQLAVVPFQYVGARTPDAAAEPAAVGLYDALKRWEGLKLASDASVQEALQRRGSGVTLIDDVTRVARSVRAGRVVWGRVVTQHDSIVVRAALYDALTGESLREVTQTVPEAGDPNALRALDYRSLVAGLLRAPKVSLVSARADRGTTSYVAWRAFERGATALARWDVDAAIPALDSAVAADPAYPQANLWLAQAKSWRHKPATEWTPNYIAANKGRAVLDARERTLVDALAAVSQEDYPSACDSYDSLRTRDSLDAIAWLGLATCRGYDRGVVPSKQSPSGWAFRGSHEAAWRALTRTLELAPNAFSALPSDFIRQIARVEYNRYRTGQAGAMQFGAIAEMVGDTVGYVPYPLAEFRAGRSPATTEAALRLNRDRMLTLLETLTQRLPDSPDVFEAMANLLEARDEITGTPNGGYSALSALDRARALSVDPSQRLRLAAADVRLHLKLADFSRASAMADSVLNAAHASSSDDASQLAALAAFAGRTELATKYLVENDLPIVGSKAVPATNGALTAFTMRAAVGACDDSLRAMPSSIVRTLGSYTGVAERQSTIDALLERPLALAAPCLGPRATLLVQHPAALLMRMQHLAAADDRRGVQRMLDSLAQTRQGIRPGALSIDHLVQEAWLAEFAGDPRRAAERLDVVLTALPTLSSFVVTEPVMAASIGRAMAYRAELAARLQDPSSAALWASRVLTLWAHADRTLDPTLSRMRRLAARQPLS